jgi:lipopolysaccharide export LptBFGC system permease protein LptF
VPLLRLQRYLLRELLLSFILVTLLVTGIITAAFMLQAIGRYPEATLGTLGQGVPIFLSLVLPITVPLSLLMACLLTYGRFADDNEFLAFQMGGVHPWHAIAPAVAASIAVSLITTALTCDINPLLTSEKKTLFRGAIEQSVAKMRSPSVTNVKINDMEMSWSGRDGEWFTDVLLTWTTELPAGPDGQKTRKTNRVTAERAAVKLTDETPMRLAVTLVGAEIPMESSSGKAGSWSFFVDLVQDRAEGKGKDEMRASELYYRMLRLEPQLGRDKGTEPWRAWRNFAGEYWRRMALGFAPFALALLGVPLGLLARRGSRSQALVVALIIAVPVYYPLLLWGDNLSRLGYLHPAPALLMGDLLIAAAGVALIWRVQSR